MMQQTVKLRWWVLSQNNSGGSWHRNDTVDQYIAVQAASATEAQARAIDICAPYMDYCDCCGEGWYFGLYEDEGTDVPEIYGKRIDQIEGDWFCNTIILHHYDGRAEKIVFPKKDMSISYDD